MCIAIKKEHRIAIYTSSKSQIYSLLFRILVVLLLFSLFLFYFILFLPYSLDLIKIEEDEVVGVENFMCTTCCRCRGRSTCM